MLLLVSGVLPLSKESGYHYLMVEQTLGYIRAGEVQEFGLA